MLQIMRLTQYHQGSSRETYTLAPPGGKYGCQPVPERLNIYFTAAFQLANFSIRAAYLTIVL